MTEFIAIILKLIFESDQDSTAQNSKPVYVEDYQNTWNSTIGIGDGPRPPRFIGWTLSILFSCFQSSLLIIIPFTSNTSRVLILLLSTCIFSLLLYFCGHH